MATETRDIDIHSLDALVICSKPLYVGYINLGIGIFGLERDGNLLRFTEDVAESILLHLEDCDVFKIADSNEGSITYVRR